MHTNNEPPEYPSELNQDDMDIPFDEQDMIEVVEDAVEDQLDENEEDETASELHDTKFLFKKHTDGVLCSAFHPMLDNIVATGGVDDIVYVWNTTNGNVHMASKPHSDSVEMVGFSYDGKYLASSDLLGNINVWNTSDYKLIRQFQLEDELSWTLWHHGANILISSSQKGLIYIFKVFNGDQKLVMIPFGETCHCGKVFPDGIRLACGYTEGNLKIVDMKQCTVLHTVKLGEKKAISCLDVFRDNNLLICGCDNGDVVLISSQGGKAVAILNSNQTTKLCDYIEAIGFCKDPTYNVASSGSSDGTLVIWDITNQIMRHKTCFSDSVNHLIWHPLKPILFTSHSNGLIHVYDSKSGTVMRKIKAHEDCIYSIAISTDARTLMTTSEDKTVRIYSAEETEPN